MASNRIRIGRIVLLPGGGEHRLALLPADVRYALTMAYLQQESDDAVILQPGSGIEPVSSVIWLHGLGADGYDFVPIVPELRLPDHCAPRFVFPHAPVRAVTINNGMPMRAWYDILGFAQSAAEDAAGIRASAALAERYIATE